MVVVVVVVVSFVTAAGFLVPVAINCSATTAPATASSNAVAFALPPAADPPPCRGSSFLSRPFATARGKVRMKLFSSSTRPPEASDLCWEQVLQASNLACQARTS